MPPKPKIDKETLVEVAFELTRAEGFASVSARSLANNLNCSTQPVFRIFENMASLKEALLDKACDYHGEFLKSRIKEDNFMISMGTAYIQFAKEEPHLFQMIFMSGEITKNSFQDVLKEHNYIIDAVSTSQGIGKEEAEKLYINVLIYIYGITAMISTNHIEFTEQEIECMLNVAVQGFTSLYK